jgi:Zn-finger in Ran binding protein and others
MPKTWQCSECETINAQGNGVCKGCLSPAPLSASTATTPKPFPGTARVARGGPSWTCPGCDTVNAGDSTACTVCRRLKSRSAASRPSASPAKTRRAASPPPGPTRPDERTGSSWAGTTGSGRPSPGLTGLTGLSDPSRFFAPVSETPPSPPKAHEPHWPRPPRPPGRATGASASFGSASRPSPHVPPAKPAPGPRGDEGSWAPPPPYRPRRWPWGGTIFGLLVVTVAAGFFTRGEWLPVLHHTTASGSLSPSAAASGPPCPAGIASGIPDGENSTIIASYSSSEFAITMCETPTGKIYYHGASKSDASMQITLPAQRSDSGFRARNNVYVYYVSPEKLVITKNGSVILSQTLRPVS